MPPYTIIGFSATLHYHSLGLGLGLELGLGFKWRAQTGQNLYNYTSLIVRRRKYVVVKKMFFENFGPLNPPTPPNQIIKIQNMLWYAETFLL